LEEALGKKEKKPLSPTATALAVPPKSNKVGAAPPMSPRGRAAAADKSADKSADEEERLEVSQQIKDRLDVVAGASQRGPAKTPSTMGAPKGEWADLDLNFDQLGGQDDDDDEYEALSYKKLKRYIARIHPRDLETGEPFSFWAKVTVRGFCYRLMACVQF